MKITIPVCGFALSLVATAGIAQAQTKEASLVAKAAEQVIWAGPQPLFIPVARLVDEKGSLTGRVLANPNDYAQLQRAVEVTKATPGYCAPYSPVLIAESFTWGTAERDKAEQAADTAPLWQQRIAKSALSLRGVVIAMTPGLSYRTNGPAFLVQIRVGRTYHQHYGASIAPGDVVSYVSDGGELTVDGVRLCMERAGEPRLTVGQRVLISGFPQDPITLPLDTDPVTDVLPITSEGAVLLPTSSGPSLTRSLAAVEADVLATAGTKRRRK